MPRNKKNNWMTDSCLDLQPGDNAKILQLTTKFAFMPKVDLNDPEAVRDRIAYFFKCCEEADMKPGVNDLANCLDLYRVELQAIGTGVYPPYLNSLQCKNNVSKMLIKKAYCILTAQWEHYMLNGKVNPVSGIFLGKNHFGYQDKSNIEVTATQRIEQEYDEAEIAKRYITDGED